MSEKEMSSPVGSHDSPVTLPVSGGGGDGPFPPTAPAPLSPPGDVIRTPAGSRRTLSPEQEVARGPPLTGPPPPAHLSRRGDARSYEDSSTFLMGRCSPPPIVGLARCLRRPPRYPRVSSPVRPPVTSSSFLLASRLVLTSYLMVGITPPPIGGLFRCGEAATSPRLTSPHSPHR